MTEHKRSIRPARAAIAAVLAFSATPLLAQELAPPPVAPTLGAPAVAPEPAPAPVAATPVTPSFAASTPVVQATPSVEERRAASIAAAEAEAAAMPAPSPRRVASRSIERVAAPVAPVAATQSAAKPTPAPVAPVVVPEPVAEPPAASAMTQQAAQTDSAVLFAMGGAALLLAGLGGAALMRRRRPIETVEEAQRMEPVAEPIWVDPAPAAVAPRAASVVPAPVTDEERTIAAMVAAPPSPENPFLTHAKRVRRAKFLLTERQAVATPPAPRQVDPVATPAPTIDRSQTVYRFGNDAVRTGMLKPRTR